MRENDFNVYAYQEHAEVAGLPGFLTLSDGIDDAGDAAEGASSFGPMWHSDFAPCVRSGYATLLYCREVMSDCHPVRGELKASRT